MENPYNKDSNPDGYYGYEAGSAIAEFGIITREHIKPGRPLLMTHEEEFCAAINLLIESHIRKIVSPPNRFVDEENDKRLNHAKAELLRIVKNEAEKDG